MLHTFVPCEKIKTSLPARQDALGRIVRSEQYSSGQGTAVIDVSNLENGTYIIVPGKTTNSRFARYITIKH